MLQLSEYKNAERVIFYFEKISKIPHGSGNTEKIADYLVSFANEQSLFCIRDKTNNVIIKKPATPGYESHPALIIQGHTDMVLAQNEESCKDLLREGIELYVDGDFLRAKGTSLGADDGIAVAYALAILEAKDIPHPPIEAVFTSDEEIGLLGAAALDSSVLEGKRMINLDSGNEEIFVAGCAGGIDVELSLPMEKPYEDGAVLKVSFFGLLGGHSGSKIHEGRTNAIKLIGEMLNTLSALAPVRIHSISGGNANNAIPSSAEVIFSSEGIDIEHLYEICNRLKARIANKDTGADFSISSPNEKFPLYSHRDSLRLINIINSLPDGVIDMSEDMPKLVESSLNLGIIYPKDSKVHLSISVRSSKNEKKLAICKSLEAVADKYGASFSTHGDYPGWEYKKESNLREVMCSVYRNTYNKEPRVIVIHAGLECGIFSDKIKDLDCISTGPDTFDIHTTDEHLSIPSLSRFWEYLKRVLSSL